MEFSKFTHDLIQAGPFAFVLILGPLLAIKTKIVEELADKIDGIFDWRGTNRGAMILFVVWVILMGWAYLWGHDLAEAYWFIKLGQWLPGEPYPYLNHRY